MMELREDPAVVLVYLVRQMAQARDELVVPQTEVDAQAYPLWRTPPMITAAAPPLAMFSYRSSPALSWAEPS